MSDRFPARIHIGGQVPIALVKGLCEAIQADGASLDYGEAAFDPQGAADLLEAVRDGRGTLRLCDDQACYGEFENTEAFCQEHAIAFDRHSDGKYEYDAERVMFRSGMKEPRCFGATQDDRLTAPVSEIHRQVYPPLKRGHNKAALEVLHDICGDTIPALKRFRIVQLGA